jgi:hypothetical protein
LLSSSLHRRQRGVNLPDASDPRIDGDFDDQLILTAIALFLYQCLTEVNRFDACDLHGDNNGI